MSLNLGAADFTPSWLKKPAAPPAAAPVPAPAARPSPSQNSRPSGAYVAPGANAVNLNAVPRNNASPASSKGAPTPQSSMMNANAEVFIPKTPIIAGSDSRKVALDGKTDADIINISSMSSLKINAASFVPKNPRRLRAALALTPLTLQPSNEDPNMLLGDTWCLYFLPTPAQNDNSFDPALVFRIDSVASFWKTFNNLPPVNELPLRSAMYLFRDDIVPKWEDPKNREGGLYRIAVRADMANSAWIRTAAKAIGESWRRSHRQMVNGVVLKMRGNMMYIEVWVSEKMTDFVPDWYVDLEPVVRSAAIDYYSHKELQAFLKDANKDSAKAGANANKKKRK